MRPDHHRYFTALGLAAGASANDIRAAYRRRIQEWHPDRFANGSLMQTTAEDETKELNEAYEWLYKKRHYRRFLGGADQANIRPVTRPVETEGAAAEPGAKDAQGGAGPPPPPGRSFSKPFFAWAKQRWKRAVLPLGLAAGAYLCYLLGPLLAALWQVNSPVPPSAEAPVAASPPSAAAPAVLAAEAPNRPPVRVAAPARPVGQGRLAALAPAPEPERPARPTLAHQWVGGTSDPAPREAALQTSPAREWDRKRPLPPSTIVLQAQAPAPAAAADLDQRLDELEAEMETFEIGDLPDRVRTVQGPPDEAVAGAFRYGSSIVYFKDGRVSSWVDGVPHLRIPRFWSADPLGGIDAFTIGSTRGEVFEIQGRPDRLLAGAYVYGTDVVYFGNDRVVSWLRTDQRLRIRTLPERLFLGDNPVPRPLVP